jgi:hypothetical protein
VAGSGPATSTRWLTDENARRHARGITCVEVDYDEMRGIESDVLELF